MEKKLQTKEEILVLNHSHNHDELEMQFPVPNILNAMTEWGNQEYEQGIEHGKKVNNNKHAAFAFIITACLIAVIISILRYDYCKDAYLSTHYENKYTNQIKINTAEKHYFDSVILSKNKINNRKADAKKALDGL